MIIGEGCELADDVRLVQAFCGLAFVGRGVTIVGSIVLNDVSQMDHS